MQAKVIVPTRRGFLKGVGLIMAAPAIVKASSLMKVSPTEIEDPRYRVVFGQIQPGRYGLIVSKTGFKFSPGHNFMVIEGDLVTEGSIVAKKIKVAHHLPS